MSAIRIFLFKYVLINIFLTLKSFFRVTATIAKHKTEEILLNDNISSVTAVRTNIRLYASKESEVLCKNKGFAKLIVMH